MVGHVWGYSVLESIGLLLPSIRDDLGLSPFEEGLLGSIPRIANFVIAMPLSWLLSGFRPKLVTSFSLFAVAGFALFQGWSPTFALLLLGRFLYSLVSVAREPARALLIRQWVPVHEIVIVNGLGSAVWGLTAVGFLITPVILNLMDGSWRGTYVVFSITCLVFAVLWQLLGRERITPEYEADVRSQVANPMATLFKYKDLAIGGLGMMGAGIGFSAFAVFWPSFMLDFHDVSVGTTSIMLAISGFVSSMGGIGIGVVASKTGRKKEVLMVAGVAATVSGVAMLFTASFSTLVLLSLLNGLGSAFIPIVFTIPFELPGIKPREIAVTLTFMTTMIWAGSFVGPLLAGAIHQTTDDQRLALIVTSLSAMLITVAGILLPRRTVARRAPA